MLTVQLLRGWIFAPAAQQRCGAGIGGQAPVAAIAPPAHELAILDRYATAGLKPRGQVCSQKSLSSTDFAIGKGVDPQLAQVQHRTAPNAARHREEGQAPKDRRSVESAVDALELVDEGGMVRAPSSDEVLDLLVR